MQFFPATLTIRMYRDLQKHWKIFYCYCNSCNYCAISTSFINYSLRSRRVSKHTIHVKEQLFLNIHWKHGHYSIIYYVASLQNKTDYREFEVGIQKFLSLYVFVDPVYSFFFKGHANVWKILDVSLAVAFPKSNEHAFKSPAVVLVNSLPSVIFTKADSKPKECTVPSLAQGLSRVVEEFAVIMGNNVWACRIVVNLCDKISTRNSSSVASLIFL